MREDDTLLRKGMTQSRVVWGFWDPGVLYSKRRKECAYAEHVTRNEDDKANGYGARMYMIKSNSFQASSSYTRLDGIRSSPELV